MCQNVHGVYQNRNKGKERQRINTLFICLDKVGRKKCIINMGIFRLHSEALQLYLWNLRKTVRIDFVISFILWHTLLQSCMHMYANEYTVTCNLNEWVTVSQDSDFSLFYSSCQLSPDSFLLFYSKDPPWISALTSDERRFISKLLTQFSCLPVSPFKER